MGANPSRSEPWESSGFSPEEVFVRKSIGAASGESGPLSPRAQDVPMSGLLYLRNCSFQDFERDVKDASKLIRLCTDREGNRLSLWINSKPIKKPPLWRKTARVCVQKMSPMEHEEDRDWSKCKLINPQKFYSLYVPIKVHQNNLLAGSHDNDASPQYPHTPVDDTNPAQGGSGAPDASIATDDEDDVDDDNLCPICYMAETDLEMPCGHKFCQSCLDEWRKKSSSCPMCRVKNKVEDAWVLPPNESTEDIVDYIWAQFYALR